MFVWSVLVLFAFASEPIPFSEGREQLFSSSADLIASYRNEKPTAPELPAVIPSSRSELASKREAPLDSASAGSTGTAPLDSATARSTGTAPLDSATAQSTGTAPLDSATAGSTATLDSASIKSATPSRPVLNRSMHLRVELLLPDFTRSFEVEYHAESNTARTTVENTSSIYRSPLRQGRIQFLKIEIDASSGAPVRRCTKSPALAASPADNSVPGLPNLEPFNFVGHVTEEGRQAEHWQNVLIGKPGDYGAARGESLNYTHDFFVYREGGDAVPVRYKVTTDSSVLGATSDTYTHRYTLLPPPTAPLIPDVATLCDDVHEYQDGRRRRRATLSREEFIWLFIAKKEQLGEHRNNDLTPESEEIVWSY